MTAAEHRIGKVQATGFMIALLAAITAIGQFATNIYLPALPSIAAEMDAGAAEAQLTLTAYLATFALTQLAYGPVSDRFGRRIVLMFGLAVFVAGSVACMLAPDIVMLIAGRVLQAFGGAACTVVARAVVRDSFDGPALQKVMALIAILFALVPGLSPLFGALLQEFAGWRSIFAVTGVAGLVVAALMVARLPETLSRRLPKLNAAELIRGYAMVMGNAAFRRFAIPNALIFAAMFAFFGGSPRTFITFLGVSPTEYGFYPPLASLGFVIGGLVVRALAGRMDAVGICKLGLAVVLAACAFGYVMPLLGLIDKFVLIGAVVAFVSGLGIFLPTAMASALQIFPDRAGTASAMMGFLQMAGAGIGSALVAVYQEPFPILAYPAIMFFAVALSVIYFLPRRARA
ncbi:MAG: hypothetical protein TEF_07615 [Rhizobiales bacterium NRL2]|jgi:DHA1 family bicyclomycin/chloramphenicol resistance-like MFS transporter|nr:MAG: hypothetical protein TEF_07615 [Rhizobiales bacterium NRL2]